MHSSLRLTLLGFLLNAPVALAQEDRPATAVEEPLPSVQLPWIEPSGEGLGLGLASGALGSSWSMEVRSRIQILGQNAMTQALVPRIGILMGPAASRFDLIAGLEFQSASPVLLNVMRLYASLGPKLAYPLEGSSETSLDVGLGGHLGFEFFQSAHLSMYIEVGGQTFLNRDDLYGPSVVAGITLYPF